MEKLNNKNVFDLLKEEMVEISGGAPTKDTSLGYDLAYYTVTGLLAIGNAIDNGIKTVASWF